MTTGRLHGRSRTGRYHGSGAGERSVFSAVCGVVNHVANVERAVLRRMPLRSHVRAGYHAVGQARTPVRAAPLQIDEWHITLPHCHQMGAGQFP
jgi:hypothetical protein